MVKKERQENRKARKAQNKSKKFDVKSHEDIMKMLDELEDQELGENSDMEESAKLVYAFHVQTMFYLNERKSVLFLKLICWNHLFLISTYLTILIGNRYTDWMII